MAINKVVYGGETLIDLTGDTVTADKLLSGITAHGKDGELVTGACTFDVDSNDATAAVAEILKGKTAYARGTKLVGTMPNNGAVSGSIKTLTDSYVIAQGYHDGSGKVGIDATEKAKLTANNIREGVTILGVKGTMTGSEGVKAQAKTVTPSSVQQTVLPDAGYTHLSQVTVAKIPYRKYLEERFHKFESQERQALNDRKEKKIRDEKYRKIMQSVQNALGNCSRQSPAEAKNLKDKMHAVKSMERRFEKEDENMTEMPEQEEAIFFKLGDKDSSIPAGKTVIEYTLAKLTTRDEKRILAEDINLKIRGSEKICIIGANGVGKTTLLRKIAEELSQRDDIKAEYMPQNYEEILDLDMTPVDFLDKSGDKEERTRIRTYLGSLKYTVDEMEHPIRELSGGQKAKVLLLSMSLSGANVLILDEPTRNFSPLSGPVIRKMLREFPGAIISISHDRKYIDEVCDKIYELDYSGLRNL